MLSALVVAVGLQMSTVSRKWFWMMRVAASSRAFALKPAAAPLARAAATQPLASSEACSGSHSVEPTSTSTAFIAAAASAERSGARPGFWSGCDWMRKCR